MLKVFFFLGNNPHALHPRKGLSLLVRNIYPWVFCRYGFHGAKTGSINAAIHPAFLTVRLDQCLKRDKFLPQLTYKAGSLLTPFFYVWTSDVCYPLKVANDS
jgi:hypothetical protein